MIILFNQVLDQKDSINKYLDFIELIERNNLNFFYSNYFDGDKRGERFSIPLSVSTMQKSNFIIILYNLIESVVTNLVLEIHNAINDDGVKFFELNNRLRKTFITYYTNVFSKQKIENSVSSMEDFYLFLSHINNFNLSYKDLVKFYSLSSGNLDSQQVRKVFNNYGLEIEIRESALKTIREGRNKLAHGEETFEEYGRRLTVDYLSDLRNKIFECIDMLLQEVYIYLYRKEYRSYDLRN